MMIRNGFILSNEQLSEVQPIVSKGLVSYEQKTYYECRAGHRVSENISPKDYFCQECNKKVTPQKIQENRLIIDTIKIITFIKETLEKNNFLVSVRDSIIEINSENKKVFVVYEDATPGSVKFSEEYFVNTVFVMSGCAEELVFRSLCPDSVINLGEVIANPNKLVDSVNSLLASSGLERPEKKEEEMDFIFENMSPEQFETFISELFEFMQNNKGALIKFMSYLDVNRANIFGSKVINLGLAGKEDCRIISLVDYIIAIIKSNNSIEGKRYRVSKSTTIGLNEKREAIEHANNAGNSLALLIATTNKIQPNIWESALRTSGTIDFKVIDLDLLKRIIFGVRAINLVDKYWGYLHA